MGEFPIHVGSPREINATRPHTQRGDWTAFVQPSAKPPATYPPLLKRPSAATSPLPSPPAPAVTKMTSSQMYTPSGTRLQAPSRGTAFEPPHPAGETRGGAGPEELGRKGPFAAQHGPPAPSEHTPATAYPSQQGRKDPSTTPHRTPTSPEHAFAMPEPSSVPHKLPVPPERSSAATDPSWQANNGPSVITHRPPAAQDRTPAMSEPSLQERNPSSVPHRLPVTPGHTHVKTELPSWKGRMDPSAALPGSPVPRGHTSATTEPPIQVYEDRSNSYIHGSEAVYSGAKRATEGPTPDKNEQMGAAALVNYETRPEDSATRSGSAKRGNAEPNVPTSYTPTDANNTQSVISHPISSLMPPDISTPTEVEEAQCRGEFSFSSRWLATSSSYNLYSSYSSASTSLRAATRPATRLRPTLAFAPPSRNLLPSPSPLPPPPAPALVNEMTILNPSFTPRRLSLLPNNGAAAATGLPSQPQPVSAPQRLDKRNSRLKGSERFHREAKRGTEGPTSDTMKGRGNVVPEEYETYPEASATRSDNTKRREGREAETDPSTSNTHNQVPAESSVERTSYVSSPSRSNDSSASRDLHPPEMGKYQRKVGQSSDSALSLGIKETYFTPRPASTQSRPKHDIEIPLKSKSIGCTPPAPTQSQYKHNIKDTLVVSQPPLSRTPSVGAATELSFFKKVPQSSAGSLSRSFGGDMIQGFVSPARSQQGRSLNRHSSQSSLHPEDLESQERSSRPSMRTSSEVRNGPVTAQPVPLEPPVAGERLHVVSILLDVENVEQAAHCADFRLGEPLEDGPPPPGLRSGLSRGGSASSWCCSCSCSCCSCCSCSMCC